MKYSLGLILLIVGLISCKTNVEYEQDISDPALLNAAMQKYSDVIVYDIFSPPQASRNYAYASIAAYEVLAQSNESYRTLAGQVHALTEMPASPTESYSPTIASLEAFFVTATNFIFSEDRLIKHREKVMKKLKNAGVPSGVFERSLAHGKKVAEHIIAWSDTDNYKQTRTFPKYSVTEDPSKWKPTPPGYMDGIEPHWNEIRTFVLDSSNQFVPSGPTPFDMSEGSKFKEETTEVYDIGNAIDDEQKEIASFWDCNPYKLNVTGHVMHATKKITPGGHWISIVGIVSRQAKADLIKTASAYALTSIALSDGFIACWDEKYRSNLVRPETIINEYIDEDWIPFLQTPPFPEHTSGHSVISRAAAVALTSIYGDNFAFDDDTEVQYGIPIRSFKSFMHASEEAAISRLYGGIHYRPAIDVGVSQGEKVGEFIINKISLEEG